MREVEEHPTEVKLEAHFRVNIKDEVNFNKFMSEFSKSSGTSYNKPRQGDRSASAEQNCCGVCIGVLLVMISH